MSAASTIFRRRQFLKHAAGVGVLLPLTQTGLAFSTSSATRPNIVCVQADCPAVPDLGSYGCYPHPMPNTERLLEGGRRPFPDGCRTPDLAGLARLTKGLGYQTIILSAEVPVATDPSDDFDAVLPDVPSALRLIGQQETHPFLAKPLFLAINLCGGADTLMHQTSGAHARNTDSIVARLDLAVEANADTILMLLGKIEIGPVIVSRRNRDVFNAI